MSSKTSFGQATDRKSRLMRLGGLRSWRLGMTQT